jgi:cholest-4-en-3-one 26-monooxygenase
MAMDDIDLMDAGAFDGGIPHDYFRRLRQAGHLPRGYDTDGEPLWFVVRHEDVSRISRDTAVFSSRPHTMTSVRKLGQDPSYPIITFLDSPEHARMRKLTFKAFTPARLAALTEPVRRIVRTLLDEVTQKGDFDLAEDIALRLPFEVLADLLCVPAGDRDMVLGWAYQTVNLGDPEYDNSTAGGGTSGAGEGEDVFRKLADYFLNFAHYRAAEPGDDLFSVLLAARLKANPHNLPDRLTPDEVGTFATTLITAGSETTYCSVTGAVLALLEHRDQLDLLRADRSLLPGATDEVLRWVTPVTHFARRAVTDTHVAGQLVRAGERVVMWYTSANRDEAVFADPDRFDIRRSPNPHLTFGGGGPHVCIGNGLALMELRLFLEGLVDIAPRLELTGTPVHPRTNFMNSIMRMPMRVR